MATFDLPPHPADVEAALRDAPAPVRSMADAPLPAFESHSSISTYAACPLHYAFRYVQRRPGEPMPRLYAFGAAVHRALEAYVRERLRARAEGGAEPGAEVFWGALERSLATSGLALDEIEDARLRAVPVLERFLALEAAAATEPVAVEIGFGVPVGLPDGEEVRFVGYVDRVDRAPDGSTVIVDYKTGRPRDQAAVDADRQLTAYAYGCARGGLSDPSTGEVLPPASRLGLYFAENGQLVSTSRTAEQLAAFEADLVATVGRIRARAFAARPAPWTCRWCEYRRDCTEASPGI